MGIGALGSYDLRWHKRSRDGSGKCDVVPTNNAATIVYGVLYEIPAREKKTLDRAEGLGEGYDEEKVEVAFKGARRVACIYHATDIDPSLKPYTWYKALVVAGAKEHVLPADYIERLLTTDATEDPNRKRDTRNWRLSMANCY